MGEGADRAQNILRFAGRCCARGADKAARPTRFALERLTCKYLAFRLTPNPETEDADSWFGRSRRKITSQLGGSRQETEQVADEF